MLTRLRARVAARHAAPPTPASSPVLASFNPHPDYPGLRKEHVIGARLFAERWDMVSTIGPRPGAVIAEVGVAMGHFSKYLLEQLQPAKFVAIDTFGMDAISVYRGRPMSVVLDGLSHIDFYRRRFADRGDQVVVEEGLSWEVLARYPDAHFDLIYVDASHDYDDVGRDTEQAVAKVKPDGMLIFNDYILFNHQAGVPYGVVQHVNRLVVEQGWQVVGFALQWNMFCDIALRRAEAVSASA